MIVLQVAYWMIGVLVAAVVVGHTLSVQPPSNYQHPWAIRGLAVVLFLMSVVIWPMWVLLGGVMWLATPEGAR